MDLEGLSLGDLRSEGFRFISKAGALLAANYPQRLHRAFLVNAPSWWAVAWKLLTPIIPKKVRERMFLFGLKAREGHLPLQWWWSPACFVLWGLFSGAATSRERQGSDDASHEGARQLTAPALPCPCLPL